VERQICRAGFTTSGSYSGDKLNTLQDLAVNAAQPSLHYFVCFF
jgi:hypothetical protein